MNGQCFSRSPDDRDALRLLHAQRLEPLAQALRQVERIHEGCTRHHDGELLSAVTASHVALTHVAQQKLTHGAQHLVTRSVTVRIVQLLEVIQVEQDQAERVALRGEGFGGR